MVAVKLTLGQSVWENCIFYRNKRQNNMKKRLFSKIATTTNMFRQFCVSY